VQRRRGKKQWVQSDTGQVGWTCRPSTHSLAYRQPSQGNHDVQCPTVYDNSTLHTMCLYCKLDGLEWQLVSSIQCVQSAVVLIYVHTLCTERSCADPCTHSVKIAQLFWPMYTQCVQISAVLTYAHTMCTEHNCADLWTHSVYRAQLCWHMYTQCIQNTAMLTYVQTVCTEHSNAGLHMYTQCVQNTAVMTYVQTVCIEHSCADLCAHSVFRAQLCWPMYILWTEHSCANLCAHSVCRAQLCWPL